MSCLSKLDLFQQPLENERTDSHEPNEPPHIHVDRDNSSAKFWLLSVGLANNIGFSAKELRRLQLIVQENKEMFLEAWYGYFGS
jgi:hypothetical protein